MKQCRLSLKDAMLTLIILILSLQVDLILSNLFETQTLIAGIFIFGVFLISLKTEGYFWGVLASLISVLAVNFAFTYPYGEFDFHVAESVVTAIIMLLVATMTCALPKRVKEQERTRAEIEKERMRANLLRAVSHDLRTPLTTIYGSCSAIIENYDSLKKEQVLKLLREISEDSEWLVRMVENLLSVTRIDGSGDHVQVAKVSTVLDELIDAVLHKFSKRYPEQEVRVEVPDEFVSIPMDAMLIEQVLINLLENAVVHARGMTELLLRVTVSDGEATFEVSDNGCGIALDQFHDLFTGRIGHNDSPTDGKRHNMSIGLSVCSAVIRAHGGRIWAENNQSGGASFFFTLETEVQEA